MTRSLSGRVVAKTLAPVLKLKFSSFKKRLTFEIDTGFSGSLLMPIEYAELLSGAPKGTEFFQQANGEVIGGIVGTATLIWFQQPKLVDGCFAETNVFLLGRKLLEKTCVFIDFNRKTLNLSRSCRSLT
ncbi:MAG: hypothetical protein SNJ55_12795 [Chloroherpetonaceae bacterium]